MKNVIRIYLTICMFLPALIVSAQYRPVTFGIKGGVNVSNFAGEGIKDSDGKIGFTAGILVDYNVDELVFVRTGLDLATKGAKHKEAGIEYTYNPIYLQLPIHAGYKLPFTNSFSCSLHVGPYLSYGIGGKIKSKVVGGVSDVKDSDINFFGSKEDGGFKKFDFGLGLGIGAEFGNVLMELGYDLGLANISYIEDNKVKNMNAYLTLGYCF
ncbi:MAG: porin family protein [Dysgonomonas sp.]